MSKPQTIRVAFADDHVASRMGIVALLHEQGGIYVEVQASHGKELIARLKLCKEPPEVCMLDVSMPVMNGLDTLIAVKKKWPQMKFLVMSAFSSEHLVLPMIRAGAGGYLTKTCHPEEIKKAIVSIHATGFYNTDLVSNYLRKDKEKEKRALTEFELILLKEFCSDKSYADIGAKHKKTGRSIEGYRDAMFEKLNVTSRIGLVIYALQSGLIPLELHP